MQYQFDAFILDTEHLTLFHQQALVSTDQRMIRLLLLLIEAYPESCSTQALLQAIWPATVVTNWSLSRLVSDSRKFFKQHGCHSPVIETVHGHGFRFGTELLLTKVPASVEPVGNVSGNVRHRRWLFTGLSGIGMAFLMVLGINQTTGMLAGNAPAETDLLYGEPAHVLGRILWVDDNPVNNSEELAFLRAKDLAIYTVTSTEDALLLLGMYHYDAVISDMGRDGDALAGLKLLQSLRASRIEIPFFFYTIAVSEQKENLLLGQGAHGVSETKQELYRHILSLFTTDDCQECLESKLSISMN